MKMCFWILKVIDFVKDPISKTMFWRGERVVGKTGFVETWFAPQVRDGLYPSVTCL